MNADGQFENAVAAASFALNFLGNSYQRPMINRMATPSAIGHSLGGLDRAAQAGMIRAEIAKLGPVKEAYVIASRAPKRFPCTCGKPCCVKSRANPEWHDALHLLVNHAKEHLGLCTGYYGLRKAIVAKYFGDQVSLTKIAEQCGVNRDTAGVHNSKIVKMLRGLEFNAWSELEMLLTARGIIVQTESA